MGVKGLGILYDRAPVQLDLIDMIDSGVDLIGLL